MSRTFRARSGPMAGSAMGAGRAYACETCCKKRESRVPPLRCSCDGADVPLGTMPDFQRTITTAKALDPDTLLAYEMNGQTLPVEHGFPLRVIASGWAGDSWVKWLQHIEVLDHEFEGFWMKSAYRHPPQPVPPGTAVDAAEMVPVTDLNVKSVIAAPRGWAKPGNVRIQGTAWSNGSPVSKVEVSTDGGQSWKSAKLGGHREQVRLASCGNTIGRRRRASTRCCPVRRIWPGKPSRSAEPWNPAGYLWNVAQPMSVTISAQAPPSTAPEAAPPESAYPEGYKAACFVCHDEHMMQQQRLNPGQWDRELNKMTGWGAKVKPEDREAILNYLSSHFKP